MRKSLFSGLILTALFTTSAFAANGKDTVFSCTATDGKPVVVKKVGNDYQYTHGQFTFKNPISQVLANPNSEIAVGSGFTTYSIELKHQGKSYRAGFLQGRGSKVLEELGVSIYKNGSYNSSVECSLTKPVTQNFAATKIRRTGL